ncbi:MAG: DAK2 domain-containing protein [Oscillospiraceae bacterium]|nr:DAK2 domain-containing protein [Oscillospiraceae bacterium]
MLDGKTLKYAYISAAVTISNMKKEVDELNVYPVPDGDTGTNMSMTMSNALKELMVSSDDLPASDIAKTAASAMLRGARGNSGVILSLLFRGFSKGLAGKSEIDCEDIVTALENGVKAAYKAVMNPTEGTILTVARVASEKAAEAALLVNDPALLWEDVCKAAEEALEKTPDQLPVLKKAGVVDAGGKGLTLIWNAMRDVFNGGEAVVPVEVSSSTVTVSAAASAGDEEITFTYCTEFIVNKSQESKDATALRAYLETIGDCVVVVDDEDIIKVHVHTDHPGKAIEEGLKFGALTNMKIDNMRMQHESKAAAVKNDGMVPVAAEKPFGFVTVAAGKGIEELFRNLGADCVVRGGQTMNPSTEDILKAVYSTPAETVFVMPNNKNIIMAAEQAAKLSERRVCVIPTRTIPQGITAMMSYDPDASFSDNRMEMTKAIERVSTGQVTFAARDSLYEGKNIKKGDILALENNKLVFLDRDVSKAAYKLTKRMIKGDSAYVTLIYGSDVSDERAEELAEIMKTKFGHVEIMLINGGQPVYYYIISVE